MSSKPMKRRSLAAANSEVFDEPTPSGLRAVPTPTPSSAPSDTPSDVPSHAPSEAPSSPRSETPTETTPPSDAATAPEPSSAPARPRRAAVRRGRDGAAQAAQAGATNVPIARILYLPADLIDPMRIYRASHGVTNTQLALRALNAMHRQITDLLAAENTPRIIPGDLFDEVAPKPPRSNKQVEITPTMAQLNTIDPLVEATGVRDRSHLFALAIRQFLTDAGILDPT